eukprot:CAMPEP_0176341940 /NCGR_PEP_ID=MMETSP0126-20121128/2778_1 /TAXON_ID=141414 ORGANISM="Strombidinopsis acuminatum, Strain SPMC142" /NCGR_SAMPLE_ID=MMETSP0126 /ASSEMBLY_ACC=CAM_ASM_000229 /LENGTH=105 /DNA_ID=CAMNT_0017687055 /DNA_START=148 /DNA_END=465 /DNA_ORIENTATION=+
MKVLNETDGDITKSKELLRKRGLADAEKRSDRVAAQGLIALALDEQDDKKRVTMIQLACETDFVAKTDKFQEGLTGILNTLHDESNFGNSKGDDKDFMAEFCKST